MSHHAVIDHVPRRPRDEDPNAFYHVYSRGNYRAGIFVDSGAARSFIHALESTIRRAGWEVYAYAVMPNHFHLLLRAPRANLSRGMHLLLSAFGSRFNGFRKEHGHVFQGRFHAKRVPPGMDALRVMDYIHLNHLRKGHLTLEHLKDSPLTSIFRLMNPVHRGDFMTGEGLVNFAKMPDTPDGWSLYLARLKDVYFRDANGRGFEMEWELARLEANRALKESGLRIAPANESSIEDPASLDQLHSEMTFCRLLAEAGKQEADIAREAGVPEWKLRIVMAMTIQTTATFVWLASRLNTGNPCYLSNLCRRGQATS